jgi:hypothetical protein
MAKGAGDKLYIYPLPQIVRRYHPPPPVLICSPGDPSTFQRYLTAKSQK